MATTERISLASTEYGNVLPAFDGPWHCWVCGELYSKPYFYDRVASAGWLGYVTCSDSCEAIWRLQNG